MKSLVTFLKKNFFESILFSFCLIFSLWLMFSTFSYENGSMLVATKAWSDFASHIPLIRSFSLGSNFPPEYPIFPGEPIRYHFLFYVIVGLLEKAGLRIDLALNILSSLSFFFLLIMIYLLAKLLFKSKFVGVLSLSFFLFNGSLSFLYFLSQSELSLPQIIFEIVKNETFPAFAPYDQTLISGGFWNLNVFTNQRHFSLPLAIVLFITCLLVKQEQLKKKLSFKPSFFLGVVLGSFSFLHGAVFIMGLIIIISFFFLFNYQKKSILTILITAFLFSLPRTVLLLQLESINAFKFAPGYLTVNDFSAFNWIRYWFLNLGVGSALIPLGFFLARGPARKVFLAFLPIFMIGNLFQFSPDIAANHKFFNLWIIVANMFSAFLLTILWYRNFWNKMLVVSLLFLITFSGVIDFFAIKNDKLYSIADFKKNPDISWIKNHTEKTAVFLNSSYLYHPASLAGRKIFLGWPYFSWSLGYDTDTRDTIRKSLFSSQGTYSFCQEAKRYNISYVAIDPQEKTDFLINQLFFQQNFSKNYENPKTGFTIYSVKPNCQKIVSI